MPQSRWLTPSGPAAIAIAAVPLGQAGVPRPPSGGACVGSVRAADGTVIDQVVVADAGDHWLVHAHGGDGVRAALDACWGHPAQPQPDGWAGLAHPAAVAWAMRHGLDAAPSFPRPFLFRRPRILITGPPNAGKSSLLNAWCGHARAAVHAQPGTTRDLVEAVALHRGWRLELVDSAGVRCTEDAVERAGVELALAERDRVDLVVELLPGGGGAEQRRALVVHARADEAHSEPSGLWWSDRPAWGWDPAERLAVLADAVLARLGLLP